LRGRNALFLKREGEGIDDEKSGDGVAFVGASRYGSRSSAICASCHSLSPLMDGSARLCSKNIKLNLILLDCDVIGKAIVETGAHRHKLHANCFWQHSKVFHSNLLLSNSFESRIVKLPSIQSIAVKSAKIQSGENSLSSTQALKVSAR
jgi:hypothetical protein